MIQDKKYTQQELELAVEYAAILQKANQDINNINTYIINQFDSRLISVYSETPEYLSKYFYFLYPNIHGFIDRLENDVRSIEKAHILDKYSGTTALKSLIDNVNTKRDEIYQNLKNEALKGYPVPTNIPEDKKEIFSF